MKEFLLINKPEGWTSFDAVAYIRKAFRRLHPDNKKIKIGHAGTLDPFATGLLIVAVGREATKRIDEFKNLPKTYLATVHLGAASNTDDKTGTIEKISEQIPDQKTVEETLKNFLGKQQQIPPMFSAKKVGGTRLYKLARKGEEVKREPSEIEIFSIKLIDYSYPLIKLEVVSSPGTYIRTLAHDLGDHLGVGAYCEELQRTKIGSYDIKDAKNPADFDSNLALDRPSSV